MADHTRKGIELKGWKLFFAGLVIAVVSSQIAKSLESSGYSFSVFFGLSVFFDLIDVGGLVMMLVAASQGVWWLIGRLRRG